jgi:hypothetical protein
MRAGFSFSYPSISLLLGQPLSIKKSYAGAIQPFYGDILRANFFDLKNSKNRQNNGNLEPLKDFGTNFFRSNCPLIYLNLS